MTVVDWRRAHEIRPVGGSRPPRAASPAGAGGVAAAQGYSAGPEARSDSASRSGARNGGVGSVDAGAPAERSRNPGRPDRAPTALAILIAAFLACVGVVLAQAWAHAHRGDLITLNLRRSLADD